MLAEAAHASLASAAAVVACNVAYAAAATDSVAITIRATRRMRSYSQYRGFKPKAGGLTVINFRSSTKSHSKPNGLSFLCIYVKGSL